MARDRGRSPSEHDVLYMFRTRTGAVEWKMRKQGQSLQELGEEGGRRHFC